MGEIITWNMLSWLELELLINRYCCIWLVVCIIVPMYYLRTIVFAASLWTVATFVGRESIVMSEKKKKKNTQSEIHKTIKPWNFRPCIQTDDDMKRHSHPKQSKSPQEMGPYSLSKGHVRFSHGSYFTQRWLVFINLCFGTTYRSIIKGQSWPLTMGRKPEITNE